MDHYPRAIRAILNYENKATLKNLRITSRVFRKITSYLPRKRSGWEVEIELTTLLFWMAAGTSYRVVAVILNVPISTVADIVHKLLTFISNEILPLVIRIPTSIDELTDIGYQFCARAGTHIFERAVGAIDGTHVTISCPVSLHSQYINRKLKYSIQTQAISDCNQKFLDVFVGFPGSVHDTRVLYNSPVYQHQLYPPDGYFLLGDSGYPCRLTPVAIITPFKENLVLSQQQKSFNNRFSKARNVVECAFGSLKNRWRNIFNRDLELKIENSVKTVAVCCVLHNICVDMDDFILSDFTVEPEAYGGTFQDETHGTAFRQSLVDAM